MTGGDPPRTDSAPRLSLPQTRYREAAALLPVIAAIATAAWVHAKCPVLPYDDAFITFRYVENLFGGEGLVYNDGQRVLGATSPLHLLFLATLKAIFPSASTPVLSVRANWIPYALTGLAAYLALRRFTNLRVLAGIGVAAILMDPILLAWSTGGMESFLFSGLALFSVLAGTARRAATAGALAGLTILSRPEGAILLPIGLFLLRGSRRDIARFGFGVVLCTAPWLIFAQIYFGSVLPLSIEAKLRPLYPLPEGYALWMLAAFLEKWITAGEFGSQNLLRSLLVASPLWASPVLAGIVRPGRERGAWLPGLLLWALALLYAVGNPLIQEWYVAPLVVFGSVSFWAALSTLATLGEGATARRGALVARAGPVFLGLVVLASAVWVADRWRSAGSPASVVTNDPARRRVEAYRTAAETLNRIATRSDAVAGPEIGSLGFYFRGRVLDACGLVSPEAHPFLPVPDEERESFAAGAISTAFVRETRPEFVATMTNFAARSLAKSDWFRTTYDPIERVPLPLPCWGSTDVFLFRRKSVSPPP